MDSIEIKTKTKSRDDMFRELDDYLCKAYLTAIELEMQIGNSQERYTFGQLVKRRIELVMLHAIKIKKRIEK